MKVELIDYSGSDLSVVDAARVSYDKKSEALVDGGVNEKDRNLIKYLASHSHWTPFAHCFLSLRLTVPIYVARQLAKHQVGLVINEESRRYVSDTPGVYLRDTWHKKPDNSKQGKGEPFSTVLSDTFRDAAADSMRSSVQTYEYLINMGVAPEQARAVLPQGTYTSFIWSGSLYAFSRVVGLRDKPDAQQETAEVGRKIAGFLHQCYPISAKALLE